MSNIRRVLRLSPVYLLTLLSIMLLLLLYSPKSHHIMSPVSEVQESYKSITSEITDKYALNQKVLDTLLEVKRKELIQYDGKRPLVNEAVDIKRILKGCGGELRSNSRNCMDYLKFKKDDYTITRNITEKEAPEIVNFHMYWRGLPTKRVALAIKSFLFTQNLKCSRLNIWLDADDDPDIRSKALLSIYLGLIFIKEIKAGIVNVRDWQFPEKIAKQHHPYVNFTNFNLKDCYDKINETNNIYFPRKNLPTMTVAVSDAIRFIVLHLFGGIYFDADNIFLRDIRPLMIVPDISFAERWGVEWTTHSYNTAILRLNPYSRLSLFLIEGGIKLNHNYHPQILGRYLVRHNRNDELIMFETALFDPVWGEFDNGRTGDFNVPQLWNFRQVWQSIAVKNEWDGLNDTLPVDVSAEIYKVYPGVNRTMQNFFAGSYTYHMHNEWSTEVELGSWMWVAEETYNDWLSGKRANLYGEYYDYKR